MSVNTTSLSVLIMINTESGVASTNVHHQALPVVPPLPSSHFFTCACGGEPGNEANISELIPYPVRSATFSNMNSPHKYVL